MKKLTFIMFLMGFSVFTAKAQTKETGSKINISKLGAFEKDNRVYVEWAADAGMESNYWEVEGSADGKNFSTVALVMGPDPGKQGEQYTWKGKSGNEKKGFYRVVYVDHAGIKQQSDIIQVLKN